MVVTRGKTGVSWGVGLIYGNQNKKFTRNKVSFENSRGGGALARGLARF